MLRARVNEEAQADKGRQGSEEVNVEVAKVVAESERQRVVQGPDHDRGEMDEDLRWKLRSIGECKMDDKFLNAHAQIWVGVCPICRIRREEGRSHDWRACPENPEDVAAVQAVHKGMAEALAKTEVSESSLAIAGSCPSCHMPRRMCWMALEHAPAGPCSSNVGFERW